MDNYMEDWIGIEAAASYLDVTKDTIRNWIKKTDIPAHKIGKLLLIFLALLTSLTIFLPVIALPNEVASLVDYKGIDVVFGKEIGMILFSGVYYSNAIINPSIMLFIGFFLPLFVTIITSLLIKNRVILII